MASPRVTVVAEAGMNHDGSVGHAKRLIEAAAACGADVVKFQTHLADVEMLPDAPSPGYFNEESRYDYFRRTAFTVEQWKGLKAHAEAAGIRFLSSVFSPEAVDLLERVGVAAYKVPSGEITNLPLLERLAAVGKPLYVSSGMSSWNELDAAVGVLRRSSAPLTILQCTSEYPCAYGHVGLNVMQEMRRRYSAPVGLSDHTMTGYASFAAVALGAAVIEKHLTLSRLGYGSDAKHSLEPVEFADLVRGIRAIETMLANPVEKDDLATLQAMKTVFEHSLVATRDIPAGASISEDAVTAKKPGTGIPASRYRQVIGCKVARTIPAGAMLQPADLEGPDGVPWAGERNA